MRLRSLFEALNNEVAIIFGRFNPPHKGHRAAWELAAKSPVWYVGTNESTVGPKDPLPYGIKVEAMTAIWPEVEGHIIAETSWLTLASLVYEKHGDVTLLCLTDEDWVTKTIIQYNGKEGAHGFYNFKQIKQKPTPRLSSATALRDAVSKDDREAFAAAAGVPADTPVAGKPFFDLVAEYLLPYANAPKKVAKKKVAAPVEGVAEGDRPGMKDGRPYSDPLRRHPGNDSYMTPEYLIQKYQDELKKIAAGPYKRPKDVAMYQARIAKLQRQQGVAEARMSAAAKLSKAWDREQQKSAASRKRGQELLNPPKKEEPKKTDECAGVGIITKQNSTKDVNKGTPYKNLKAFKLVK